MSPSITLRELRAHLARSTAFWSCLTEDEDTADPVHGTRAIGASAWTR